MNIDFEGQVALVTASTGGIGEAIATALAREGATVVVNGRSQATVAAAADRIAEAAPGARLRRLASDNGTAAGVQRTIEELPAVDILVNNLGTYEAIPFFETTDAQWLASVEVNVMSGVRLSRHYLQGMLARNRGRVLFIASEAAVVPAAELPHYSATKAMQLSLSRILAELTKGTQVTVNAILPGSTGTEGVRDFVQGLYPGLSWDQAEQRFMAEGRASSLIGRLIRPREVADLAAFIASGRASAINGAALRVDGGLIRTIV